MEKKSFLFDLDSGKPTSPWDKAFERVGKHGFKISSDTSLLDVPTVKVDLESGSLEVQCRGFQERPPHEGFNHLKTPFLPWGWPSTQDQDHSRSAFVFSQDYASWSKRLEVLRKFERSISGKSFNVFLEGDGTTILCMLQSVFYHLPCSFVCVLSVQP